MNPTAKHPPPNAPLTLEQRRAQDTWNRCEKYAKEHVNFAKGLPALIMNSGLMQVLAFCHDKKGACEQVATDLRCWLSLRFKDVAPDSDFGRFMESLLWATPADYQAVTTEAHAWLRWLRQMAAARVEKTRER